MTTDHWAALQVGLTVPAIAFCVGFIGGWLVGRLQRRRVIVLAALMLATTPLFHQDDQD